MSKDLYEAFGTNPWLDDQDNQHDVLSKGSLQTVIPEPPTSGVINTVNAGGLSSNLRHAESLPRTSGAVNGQDDGDPWGQLEFFEHPKPNTAEAQVDHDHWGALETQSDVDSWGEFEYPERVQPANERKDIGSWANSVTCTQSAPHNGSRDKSAISAQQDPWASLGVFESSKGQHSGSTASTKQHFIQKGVLQMGRAIPKEKFNGDNASQSSFKQRLPRDTNVLFDAEDLSDDDAAFKNEDDFGEFETASPTSLIANSTLNPGEQPPPVTRSKSMNTSLSFPDVRKTASRIQDRRTPLKKILSGRNRPQTSSSTAPSVEGDDTWSDFVTAEVPSVAAHSGVEHRDDHSALHDNALVQSSSSPTTSKSRSAEAPLQPTVLPVETVPPPTNIPPPGLLLTLIPPLLATIGDTEVHQGGHQSPNFLKHYIAIARVAGRIIAGRKFRWKRDTLLSQSMRIGQAGRPGGMKLAGLDKSENVKEEKEVSDVVWSWRSHVGKLRSSISSTTDSSLRTFVIPDLQGMLHVRIATDSEGAMPSSRSCVLCGLKRNERVNKVDGKEVEDYLGLWWVEHWGHLECKNFWETYNGRMRQR